MFNVGDTVRCVNDKGTKGYGLREGQLYKIKNVASDGYVTVNGGEWSPSRFELCGANELPRGTGILFLDVDGVLNTHENDPEVACGQIQRDKIQLLNGVLRKTGAKIVLSSAWRYIVYRDEATLMGLEWLFRSHGLIAGRLLDITRKDTMLIRGQYDGKEHWPMDNERGQQITDWLGDMDWIERYAVVDDLDLGISAKGHPFVQTDGKVGLTANDADRLCQLLGC